MEINIDEDVFLVTIVDDENKVPYYREIIRKDDFSIDNLYSMFWYPPEYTIKKGVPNRLWITLRHEQKGNIIYIYAGEGSIEVENKP